MAFSPATSVRLATIAFAGAAVTASALPVQAAPTPAPAPEQTTVSPAQKRAQALRDKRAAARERANRARASLVRVALNQKGDRYVGGASGPNAFDCSGLTWWTYKQVGVRIDRKSVV